MLYLVTRRRPVAGALIVVGIYAALGAILAIVTDRIRTGAPAISDG